jgi:2-iminobutanoate/2-iminopropanoate deaminase
MYRSIFFLLTLICSIYGYSTEEAIVSSAVKAGNFVYVSAQLPINPSTGQMIEGDMEVLTTQVINNIQQVLKKEGLKLKDIVKTEVYLVDIRDYQCMNAAYGAVFNFKNPPARDVIATSALPFNAQISISCVAYNATI